MHLEKTSKLYEEAKAMIPGATQLFGKRQEMFAPEQWPAYFAEAKGCTVTDLDGNQYIDMGTSGIGATVLGYADPDVTAAVVDRAQRGNMCMLNPPEEVELAKLLLAVASVGRDGPIWQNRRRSVSDRRSHCPREDSTR